MCPFLGLKIILTKLHSKLLFELLVIYNGQLWGSWHNIETIVNNRKTIKKNHNQDLYVSAWIGLDRSNTESILFDGKIDVNGKGMNRGMLQVHCNWFKCYALYFTSELSLSFLLYYVNCFQFCYFWGQICIN